MHARNAALGKHRQGQQQSLPQGGRRGDRRTAGRRSSPRRGGPARSEPAGPRARSAPRGSRGGRVRGSDLREIFAWGAFGCLLVPLFLIGTGTPLGTSLLTTIGLLVLGAFSWVVLRAAGLAQPEPDLAPDFPDPPAEVRADPAPLLPADPAPALPAAAQVDVEHPRSYHVEAGWADETPADGSERFTFPLYRDERPDRYR